MQPDTHETRLLTGSFLEKEEYSTCTRDDFAPVAVHVEPQVGTRDAMMIKALMEEAMNPPAEPEPGGRGTGYMYSTETSGRMERVF